MAASAMKPVPAELPQLLRATISVADETWAQPDHADPAFRARVRFDAERLGDLLTHIRALRPDGGKLLEIGAAPYILTAGLADSGFDLTVNGLPVGGAATAGELRLETQLGVYSAPLHLFDAEDDFPFETEAFDVVVAGEVFEHFYRQPWAFLSECRRVLRQDGLLILTTPNGHSLDHLYLWLARGTTGMGFNPDAPSVRHAREYSREEILAALESLGFAVDDIAARNYSHIGADGFPGMFGPVKRSLHHALARASERTRGPLAHRGNTLIVVARARHDRESRVPDFLLYAISDARTGYNF